jgi:hypothetical protein
VHFLQLPLVPVRSIGGIEPHSFAADGPDPLPGALAVLATVQRLASPVFPAAFNTTRQFGVYTALTHCIMDVFAATDVPQVHWLVLSSSAVIQAPAVQVVNETSGVEEAADQLPMGVHGTWLVIPAVATSVDA